MLILACRVFIGFLSIRGVPFVEGSLECKHFDSVRSEGQI